MSIFQILLGIVILLFIFIFFLTTNILLSDAQLNQDKQIDINKTGSPNIHKLPSTQNQWLDGVIIILTGGAVTTWLTFFFDNRSRKRQIFLDVSKHKIENLSKIIPIYSHLATFSIGIHRELKKYGSDLFNCNLCLYYFCSIVL